MAELEDSSAFTELDDSITLLLEELSVGLISSLLDISTSSMSLLLEDAPTFCPLEELAEALTLLELEESSTESGMTEEEDKVSEPVDELVESAEVTEDDAGVTEEELSSK